MTPSFFVPFLEKHLEVSEIIRIFAGRINQSIDMTREECINILTNYTETLKSEYGITSLSLFGSMARGEQNEESDVDVYVETLTPNPFILMDAKDFLRQVTNRPVDIVRNHRNLNPRLKKRIERDAIVVF